MFIYFFLWTFRDIFVLFACWGRFSQICLFYEIEKLRIYRKDHMVFCVRPLCLQLTHNLKLCTFPKNGNEKSFLNVSEQYKLHLINAPHIHTHPPILFCLFLGVMVWCKAFCPFSGINLHNGFGSTYFEVRLYATHYIQTDLKRKLIPRKNN